MADALPKGWKSAKSTRRPDQTYYYHRFGEATWDRPSIPAPKASKRVRFKTALKPARCPPSPVGDCKQSSVQEYYRPQSSTTSTAFATVARHNTDSYDYIYDSPSHSYSGYSTSYSSRSYEISSPYQSQSTSRMGELWAGIGPVIGTLSIVGIAIAMIVGTLWTIKIAVLATFEIVVQVPGRLASSLSALVHILLYPFSFVMPALEWCWELFLIPVAAMGQAVQLVTRFFLFLILSPLTLIKGGLNILSGEGIQYRMGGDNTMSSWLQAPSIPSFHAPSFNNNSSNAFGWLCLVVFVLVSIVFFNKMDRQTAAIDALAETVSETGDLLVDGLAKGAAFNVEVSATILHRLGMILNAVVELKGTREGPGGYGQARVGMPARGLITAGGEATTGRKIGVVASAVTIATGVAALGGACNVM